LERKASGEVHEDEEPAAIVGRFGLVCWLGVGVGAVVVWWAFGGGGENK
jgi:hypothetical protein